MPGGVSKDWPTNRPTINNPDFAVRAFTASPAPQQPCALLVGFGAPVSVNVSGCTILVATDAAVLTSTDASGVARYPIPVPAAANLLGSKLTLQALLARASGPFLGIAATTAGLEITIGT